MAAKSNVAPAQRFIFPTKLGWMAAVTRGDCVCELSFGHDSPDAALTSLRTDGEVVTKLSPWQRSLRDRLSAFALGKQDDLCDIPLETSTMTPFRRLVTERCRKIAPGETITYAELAEAVGSPGAARAVGTVMSRNPFPLVVPCHRVLGAAGKLGGYSAPGGLVTKRKLLDLEQALGKSEVGTRKSEVRSKK
jgi:methylated-DNA-[protein]-cysteine S-methyltransferase